MITFDKVSKRYRGVQDALCQVSFHMDSGEMAFLTGHSGAGKSTLLRLLAMVEKCSGGDVFLGGTSLKQVKSRQIPHLRRTMGVISQSPNLLDDRDVFHNVALPLMVSGCSKMEISKRVRTALDMVGLRHKEKVMPLELSAGQKQRIGIARAVVHKPSLILADEPTGNLDPTLSKDIMSLFSTLNDFGVTVLIATHDLSLIATMRYPIYVLKNGRLVC
jgi:cell division transport system ATP-binding protein